MKEFTIPNFLTAKTPGELRKAMLMKQVQLSMKLHFYAPTEQKGGGWIVWYEVPISVEGIRG